MNISLQSCKTPRCDKCDVVYILKNYIKPLMQCLTNDIREYNMQLITTKCLNTAVMLMYFILGTKGLKHSSYCDSYKVIERHEQGIDHNASVLKKISSVILSKRGRYRSVYYILINDASLDHPTKGQIYFPGHVFIIEKNPPKTAADQPSYQVYQSYINQYDLNGYVINENGNIGYSYKDMLELIRKLTYILSTETWDASCVKYWKEFTHVDSLEFLDARIKNKLFICLSYERVKYCVENIEKYVKGKLKEISDKHPESVHGNPAYYRSNSNPLTHRELKINLESILYDINKNKYI